MTALWPWLAVAGLGALHGLSPTTGWMFAAAWGVRARDAGQVRHALGPIAVGHALSVALVPLALLSGLAMNPAHAQGLAGLLLLGAAACRLLPRVRWRGPAALTAGRAGHAGVAAWSFLMATAHGAGLVLVPALMPLCLSDGPGRELAASGSLAIALAGVAVHTAAMVATTALVASGVCRGLAAYPRLLGSAGLGRAWTLVLAAAGALLIQLR